MTKQEALAEVKKPTCDLDVINSDKEFVIKKLEFTKESFEEYMKSPIRSHHEFKNDLHYHRLLEKGMKIYFFFKHLFIRRQK